MSVSVIIPTCNESLRIGRLINHLTLHGGAALKEIIVVDAAATEDDTLSYIPKGKAEGIKSTSTCRAIQMNEGAALATGEILYFVHADVIPPGTFLNDILGSVRKGNDYGFFSYIFNSERFLLKVNSYFTRYPNLFTGGGDQTFFIKKNLFDQMQGFCEKVVMMEDFEIFYRLKKLKYKFEIIQNPVLVSARKYDHNSYLKVNIVNLITLVLFKTGYPLDRLKRFYYRVLKME